MRWFTASFPIAQVKFDGNQVSEVADGAPSQAPPAMVAVPTLDGVRPGNDRSDGPGLVMGAPTPRSDESTEDLYEAYEVRVLDSFGQIF
jgi:hypothetical protein